MHALIAKDKQLLWLRSCYFCYFAVLGIIVPFLGLFFIDKGFSPKQIGFLLASIMFTRVIAPNLWAWITDKLNQRIVLVKIGALLSVICFLPFNFVQHFFSFLACLLFFSFFWNAILAQLEVITLQTLNKQSTQYGRVRSWGSIGFIFVVVFGGVIIEKLGVNIIPLLCLLFLMGLFLSTLFLQTINENAVKKINDHQFRFDPSMSWFFIAVILLQMSSGPFYGFFVIYLTSHGYSETFAGLLLALGVIAEIVMFLFAPKLMTKFSIKTLLIFCLVITCGRWLMVAYGINHWIVIALSQLLHAFTFALFHAAAIQFIHQHFIQEHQNQAQALYISLGLGLGAGLGVWICGLLWQYTGVITWGWIFATICAFLSLIFVCLIQNNKLTPHK